MEKKTGREVILAVRQDIGKALIEACSSMEEDGMCLAQDVCISRKAIFEVLSEFDGLFNKENKTSSVLKSFQMIQEVRNIEIHNNDSAVDVREASLYRSANTFELFTTLT